MNLEERIGAFSKLAAAMENIPEQLFFQAESQNPWFTVDNQKQAVKSCINQLSNENLNAWLKPYQLKENIQSQNVLIIMAGNIPLVGFHDLLSVLITSNKAVIKMSSHDSVLLPYIIDMLVEIESRFADFVGFIEDVKGKKFDAIIATGSNQSAKYFEYYFQDVKKIIRKNRNSLAVLDGSESKTDLSNLAKDVFSYFGLGCRNVSKVFLPKNYDLDLLFEAFFSFQDIIEHKKYANNYDYHKSIFLMGSHQLIENGFLLLKEDTSLNSPLAMLHYEYYEDMRQVEKYIEEHEEKLQCVVSKDKIPFGQAQNPHLWNYADGVDTIEFLTN